MKKKFIPILIGAIVLVAIGVVVFNKIKNSQTQNQEQAGKKKKVSRPINVIPQSERPYVKLVPDSSGHYITIILDTLNKEAKEAEYELEYQSGTLLQGFQGILDLADLPVEDKKLFGSRSAGGSVTYHEDIKGGNLLLELDDGAAGYAVKSDWKYISNLARESEFSSKDAKFQISSKDLSKQRNLIIYNSPGYPKGLEKPVVSEVYSLTSSSTLTGTADLTIRATEEGDLSIMGWDGKEWTKFDSTVEEKMVEAEVDLMEAYLVVTN
jgi:hypothetical protein